MTIQFDPRLTLAILAGKVAAVLSRRLGRGGGTTLPGHIARRVDPRVLAKLAAVLAEGAVAITGTNGKTTTSRLIAAALERSGRRLVHNRTGANLIAGVTAALVGRAGLAGRVGADVGLFEIDEASVPGVLRDLTPRALCITNLFRDQLDRYGEVTYVAGLWKSALTALPTDATVVLNADDPAVAALGEGLRARVLYYGLEDRAHARLEPEHAHDARYCWRCQAPYAYDALYYAHLGVYRCPRCGWTRPTPDVAVESAAVEGVDGVSFRVRTPAGPLESRVPLPGLYNLYNALAALATVHATGVPPAAAAAAIAEARAAFGRVERVRVGERAALLALVKNPVGFNQVLRTILASPGPVRLAILINDNFADGTDISWLWDVDFEVLAGRVAGGAVGGTRAEDMVVRLKYAGVDTAPLEIVRPPAEAFDRALAATPPGETLYVLPTYTAMLELRGALAGRGLVPHFWEN